jgi:hypothetical protein
MVGRWCQRGTLLFNAGIQVIIRPVSDCQILEVGDERLHVIIQLQTISDLHEKLGTFQLSTSRCQCWGFI